MSSPPRRRCRSFAVDAQICVECSGCAAPLMEVTAVYASQMHAACIATRGAARTLAWLDGTLGGAATTAVAAQADVPAFVQTLLRVASSSTAAATKRAHSSRRRIGDPVTTAAVTPSDDGGGSGNNSSSSSNGDGRAARRVAAPLPCTAAAMASLGHNAPAAPTTGRLRHASLIATTATGEGGSGARSNGAPAASDAAGGAAVTASQLVQLPANLAARVASLATTATLARRFTAAWHDTVATVYAREEVMTQWSRGAAAIARAECARRVGALLSNVCACETHARVLLWRQHREWADKCTAQLRAMVHVAKRQFGARAELAQHVHASKQRYYDAWLSDLREMKIHEIEHREALEARHARRRMPWFSRRTRASPPSLSSSPSPTSARATLLPKHEHAATSAPLPTTAAAAAAAVAGRPQKQSQQPRRQPPPPSRQQQQQQQQQQPLPRSRDAQMQLQQFTHRTQLPPLLKRMSSTNDMPIVMSVEDETMPRRGWWH